MSGRQIDMPRPPSRCQLENGIKLDLNRLAQRGFIQPGAATGPVGIAWNSDYWGEIATGTLTSDMSGANEGWFRIRIDDDLDQRILLVARPRHFGGRQWYFICPYMNRRVSVLWRPNGAQYFACRQRWGRSVAYASQCCDSDSRAHRGQAKIRGKLCSLGGFDPEQWDFPPKPKGMRWRTYQRLEERFDRYEAILDDGIEELAARFGWLK